MKTGLTLGKYAPFHKGHQFVDEFCSDVFNGAKKNRELGLLDYR